jgi:hypothetical protein
MRAIVANAAASAIPIRWRARYLVRMRRLLVPALLAVAFPATAAAGPLQDLQNGGSIQPCKYSDQQLSQALGGLPPDVEQYSPDFSDELNRARGSPCGGGGSTNGSGVLQTVPPVPASSGGPPGGAAATARVGKPPTPPSSQRKRLATAVPAVSSNPGNTDAPQWAVLVLALLALPCALLALAWRRGVDLGRLTRSLRISFGEAGTRTGDRLVQVWETVRFGR